MAEQWLSIVEYARTFSISDMTVRRRIKTGKLHAVLKDGKYYIPVPVNQTSRVGASISVPQPGARSVSEARIETHQSRPAGEMVIIKGHPMAGHTFNGHEPAASGAERRYIPETAGRTHQSVTHQSTSHLPTSLEQPLETRDTSLVDTRALLAFCDASMKKLADAERNLVAKYKYKVESLETTIRERDLEIDQLRQQVEDMQLLIKMLEGKRGAA